MLTNSLYEPYTSGSTFKMHQRSAREPQTRFVKPQKGWNKLFGACSDHDVTWHDFLCCLLYQLHWGWQKWTQCQLCVQKMRKMQETLFSRVLYTRCQSYQCSPRTPFLAATVWKIWEIGKYIMSYCDSWKPNIAVPEFLWSEWNARPWGFNQFKHPQIK